MKLEEGNSRRKNKRKENLRGGNTQENRNERDGNGSKRKNRKERK